MSEPTQPILSSLGSGIASPMRTAGRIFQSPGLLISLGLTVLLGWAYFEIVWTAGPLWRDEVNTASFVQSSIPHAWRLLFYDSFPFGYTLITKCWTLVAGTSDAAYRVWCGMTALLVITCLWIATAVLGRCTPRIAIAVLASPLTAFQICGLRAYGAAICAGLLATAALFACARSTKSWRMRVTATLLCIAAVQLLYNNTAIIAAAAIGAAMFGWMRQGWRSAVWPLISAALSAITLLPYLSRIKVAQGWSVIVVDPSLPFAPRLWQAFRLGVGGVFAEPLSTWIAIGFLLIFVSAVVVAITDVRQSKRLPTNVPSEPSGALVVGLVVALMTGAALYLAFLYRTGADPAPWYFAPVLSFLGVCADAIFGRVRGNVSIDHTPRRIVGIVCGIAASALACAIILANRDGFSAQATNVPEAAREVSKHASADDLIVLEPWYFGITFDRYYAGRTPWITIPELQTHKLHRYDIIKHLMTVENPNAPQLSRIESTLRAGHSVWLISPYPPQKGPVSARLPIAPLPGSAWSQIPFSYYWRQRLYNTLFGSAASITAYRIPPSGRVKRVRLVEQVFVFDVRGRQKP